MAAEDDYPTPLSMLDGNYRKENVAVIRDEKLETFEIIKHPNIGKPPQHVGTIQHSVSSAQLPTELVNRSILKTCVNSFKTLSRKFLNTYMGVRHVSVSESSINLQQNGVSEYPYPCLYHVT